MWVGWLAGLLGFPPCAGMDAQWVAGNDGRAYGVCGNTSGTVMALANKRGIHFGF